MLRKINAKDSESTPLVDNNEPADLQENVGPMIENEILENNVEVGNVEADVVQDIVEHPTPNLEREAPTISPLESHPIPSKSNLLTISLTQS